MVKGGRCQKCQKEDRQRLTVIAVLNTLLSVNPHITREARRRLHFIQLALNAIVVRNRHTLDSLLFQATSSCGRPALLIADVDVDL